MQETFGEPVVYQSVQSRDGRGRSPPDYRDSIVARLRYEVRYRGKR